jgi:flagellar motor protein MotB
MVMTSLHAGRVAVAIAIFLAAAVAVPAVAQDLSAIDIVKALKPKPKVRAFTLEQMARESRQNDVVVRLQKERTRGITIEEKDEIAAVIEEGDLPEVDLEVSFAVDSDEIVPEAFPILETLGAALNDEQLKGSVFLLAGYADAEEADGVSAERAEAVRGLLVDKFGIDPARLVAVGFDEGRPGGDEPLAGKNRRVRVVNMASQKAAKSGE